jgi:hypothetical protein
MICNHNFNCLGKKNVNVFLKLASQRERSGKTLLSPNSSCGWRWVAVGGGGWRWVVDAMPLPIFFVKERRYPFERAGCAINAWTCFREVKTTCLA